MSGGRGEGASADVRPTHRRRSWLQRAMDSDDGRVWLATVPTVVLVLVFSSFSREHFLRHEGWDGARRLTYVVLAMALVSMYAGFVALTLRRFGPLAGRALERDLRTVSRGARKDSWTARWGLTYGSTLDWTASVSAWALLLVLIVMLDPVTRGDVLLRVLCAVVVAASWAVLLVSQALAYARLWAQHGGIMFADTPAPVFADFLALAAFVSTLFGTGDAHLTGHRARAVMRDHVLVAFAFNSMLVASLATLLLSTA